VVTWGLLSAAMALIWNEWSFLVVRFLLGAAEAGFFPGIILFLTYWFPESIALAWVAASWPRSRFRRSSARRYPG
jgi:MFS family permease